MRKRSNLFMNLLIVTADLPRPAWGASARNFHLLKALTREHSVSLLALVGSAEAEAYGDIRQLKDVARSVQLIPRPMSHSKRRRQLINIARGQSYLLNLFILQEMQAALDALLARDNYDVVLF